MFILGPVSVAKLIKLLGENKSKLFMTPGYKLTQGVVHALVLQLVGAGILSIFVHDESKEGANGLMFTDFIVNWAIVEAGDEPVLAYTDIRLWCNLNLI